MSRPTIRTIAEAAGVSIATVSYVLNERDKSDPRIKISEPTRRRVTEAAEELGYWPSQMARGFRKGRTDQVCLVLDNLDSPWAQAMVTSVSAAAHRIGKTTLALVDGDWRGFLARQGADGAVLPADYFAAEDEALLRRLAANGLALVVFDGYLEPAGFDVVRLVKRPAVDEAMDLLLSRHRRIACLRHSASGVGTGLYKCYTAGLKRAGIPLDRSLVRDTFASRSRSYREVIDLLQHPDRPSAVFATSDLAAVSAVGAAHRLGIRVPDDLEIVGIGNTPEGQVLDPPLTTVGAHSVFDEVAGLLVARLTGTADPAGRTHDINWSLFRRGTTR